MKGQITLAIILGLLVLGFVAVLLMIYRVPDVPVHQSSALKMHVEECLYQSGSLGLAVLGLKGLYITEPAHYFKLENFSTAALYYYGDVILPPISAVLANLSYFIDQAVPLCVNISFYGGEALGMPVTSAIFAQDRFLLHMDWPVIVNGAQVNDYRAKIPMDFMRYYNATANIVNMTAAHPLFIDQIYLLKQFMNISYYVMNETVLYTVSDMDENYTVMFAVGVERDV